MLNQADKQLVEAIKQSVAIAKQRRRLGHRYDMQCKCNLCVKEKQLKLQQMKAARG